MQEWQIALTAEQESYDILQSKLGKSHLYTKIAERTLSSIKNHGTIHIASSLNIHTTTVNEDIITLPHEGRIETASPTLHSRIRTMPRMDSISWVLREIGVGESTEEISTLMNSITITPVAGSPPTQGLLGSYVHESAEAKKGTKTSKLYVKQEEPVMRRRNTISENFPPVGLKNVDKNTPPAPLSDRGPSTSELGNGDAPFLSLSSEAGNTGTPPPPPPPPPSQPTEEKK